MTVEYVWMDCQHTITSDGYCPFCDIAELVSQAAVHSVELEVRDTEIKELKEQLQDLQESKDMLHDDNVSLIDRLAKHENTIAELSRAWLWGPSKT